MRARWHHLILICTAFLLIGCDAESMVNISESVAQAESSEDSSESTIYHSSLCTSGTKEDRLSCLLSQYHSESGAYGSLIYIVDAQGNSYQATNGTIQKGEEIPPTINDTFRAGEISELFTALALVRYANMQDNFTLDDYASSHLPDAFNNEENLSNIQNVLISTLLKHRSGYADYVDFQGDAYFSNPTESYSLDSLLESFYTAEENYDYISLGTTFALHESTLFYPGNAFFHSSINYYLAGEILKEVNGTDSLETIFSDTLDDLNSSMYEYTALQINNTHYPTGSTLDDMHFYGYTKHNDNTYDITGSSPSFFGAAGAIVTNAHDLMNLTRFLNSAQFQSTSFYNSNLEQFDSTNDMDIGYGYGIKEIEGRYIGQDGLVPGFRSFAYYDSQSALNIVIASNFTKGFDGGIDGIALMKKAVEIFE